MGNLLLIHVDPHLALFYFQNLKFYNHCGNLLCWQQMKCWYLWCCFTISNYYLWEKLFWCIIGGGGGGELIVFVGNVMWIVELPKQGLLGSLKEKLERVDPPWSLVLVKMARRLNRFFFVITILISLKGCENDSSFSCF